MVQGEWMRCVRGLLVGIVTFAAALAAACGLARPTAREPIDESWAAEAESTLTAYFTALHEGRYSDAAALYSGSYEVLRDSNPDVDPQDHAKLFERWCTQNGGQCLRVRSVVSRQTVSKDQVEFVVQFSDEDGALFIVGPCCGEPDTGRRQTDFAFVVQRVGGSFRVLGLPPYVP